jgi:uncharacterized membrane protein YdjX (TVP38/TMEM64 family)
VEPDHEAEEKSTSGGYIAKVFIVVLVLGVLFVAFKYFGIQAKLQHALSWIEGLGVIAPIVFAGVYIVACVFLISGAVLTLGAGAIFGLAWGTLYASVASMLGATAAFLVGRYVARSWVAKKIEGNQTFKAIDEAVADEGWKIVGLTRLSPVFPFVLLNYAFGLTKVKLKDYFFASWIGMLPGTFMYVYIGYLGREAAGATGGSTSTLQWVLRIVGFAATILVTVMVTRIARKALSKRIDEPRAEVAAQHGDTS